ncbi:MAG: hypothetical protein JJ992_12910, partial [Planctomycetes bacterium]|nr:hypothetical protein [Planctomycetota bacterium]
MTTDQHPAQAILLHAIGQDPTHRLSFELREGAVLRMGRAPKSGWTIPWDRSLSREQADLTLLDGRLRVVCVETALNPIVYRGHSHREITLEAGDEFTIGCVHFRVASAVEEVASSDDRATTEMTIDAATDRSGEPARVTLEQALSAAEVRQVGFADAVLQMETLAQLPSLISSSHSDAELARMLTGLLLEAIPQAQAAAVIDYDVDRLPAGDDSAADFPPPRLMRADTRSDFRGRFRPSRRLIAKTLLSGQSVIQTWGAGEKSAHFTMSEGLGWAYTTPIPGDSCRGWCLYVSGRGARSGSWDVRPEDLQADLRFTELVAQFIGAVRQVRLLQEQKTQLSAFFSPKVIESLTDRRNRSSLTPDEREITVLFCDVRGFSRKSEELQADLPTLLKSVSAALETMAHGILDQDGTIADFQGDAALGFWGWPVPT